MKLLCCVIAIYCLDLQINGSDDANPHKIVTTMEQSFADNRELVNEHPLTVSSAPFNVIIEVRDLTTGLPILFGGSIISDRLIVSSYKAMISRQPGSEIWFLFGNNRHTLNRFHSAGFHSTHTVGDVGMNYFLLFRIVVFFY